MDLSLVSRWSPSPPPTPILDSNSTSNDRTPSTSDDCTEQAVSFPSSSTSPFTVSLSSLSPFLSSSLLLFPAESSFPLQALPKKCLRIIFERLSARDRNVTSLVCKKWFHVERRMPYRMRTQVDQNYLLLILRRFPYIQTLHLKAYSLTCNLNDSNSSLEGTSQSLQGHTEGGPQQSTSTSKTASNSSEELASRTEGKVEGAKPDSLLGTTVPNSFSENPAFPPSQGLNRDPPNCLASICTPLLQASDKITVQKSPTLNPRLALAAKSLRSFRVNPYLRDTYVFVDVPTVAGSMLEELHYCNCLGVRADLNFKSKFMHTMTNILRNLKTFTQCGICSPSVLGHKTMARSLKHMLTRLSLHKVVDDPHNFVLAYTVCTNLEELSLGENTSVDFNTVLAFGNACKSLTRLDLTELQLQVQRGERPKRQHCLATTDQCDDQQKMGVEGEEEEMHESAEPLLSEDPEGWVNLQELRVQSCTYDSAWMERLLSRCSGLRRLQLTDCRNLTDRQLSTVGSVCPLSHVQLERCSGISDKGIVILVSECGITLETLTLSDCGFGVGALGTITGESLRAILTHCCSLKELTVKNIPWVGEWGDDEPPFASLGGENVSSKNKSLSLQRFQIMSGLPLQDVLQQVLHTEDGIGGPSARGGAVSVGLFSCHALEYLFLGGLPRLSDRILLAIADASSGLKRVELRNNSSLTERCVLYLLSKCSQGIEEFTFTFEEATFSSMVEATVLRHALQCRKLKALELGSSRSCMKYDAPGIAVTRLRMDPRRKKYIE